MARTCLDRSARLPATVAAEPGSPISFRTPPGSWTTSRLFSPAPRTLFNHAPAKLFMNTGSGQFGRPSLGSWVTYGLGSEANNLPGFVVLQSGPRGPRGGASTGARVSCPPRSRACRFAAGRPDPQSRQSSRHLRHAAAAHPRRACGTSTSSARWRPATLKSTPASPPTKWRAGCSRAPRNSWTCAASAATLGLYGVEGGQTVLRPQLPARPPPRRAGHAVRPVVSYQLGQPRRPRRKSAETDFVARLPRGGPGPGRPRQPI
jgi:hypothetical protein